MIYFKSDAQKEREKERKKRNYSLSRFCYFEFVLERIFYKQ